MSAPTAYPNQLIRNLGRVIGRVQATAEIALTRAKYSDVIGDERDLLAKALQDIAALCESLENPGSSAAGASPETP